MNPRIPNPNTATIGLPEIRVLMEDPLRDDFRDHLTLLLKDLLEQRADSSPFCKTLLQPDPCDHRACIGGLNAAALVELDAEQVRSCCQGDIAKACVEGVPTYPLYKQLAAFLCNCSVDPSATRASLSTSHLMELESHQERIHGWLEQVQKHGSALLQAFKEVKYRLHVQDKYLTQLRDGSKIVEGRCATGFYTRIEPDDFLLFNNSLLLKVKEVRRYNSFKEMLETEGLQKVLPGVQSIHQGIEVYRQFYSEETELKGVLAIHIDKFSIMQPPEILRDLLQSLDVEGMMWMLGLNFTKGTVAAALPPPRSLLLTSFLATNSNNASTSRLTVGGRAFAKHAHRSGSGWWGRCTGTEAEKNRSALNIICRIINGARWMNIHHLPEPPFVFEIREKDGYGARWSSDGMQFRGFLEPPMEDGHGRRWRH